MTVPKFLRRKRVANETVPETDPEVSGNRRDMFKMLGAGVDGAVGASLLDASPAAANGTPVELGEVNTATSTTEVITSSGHGLYGVQGSPTGLDSKSGFEAGVFGDSNEDYGVVGFSNRFAGVLGQVGGNTISQTGVRGDDTTSLAGNYGVMGTSTYGNAVIGIV
jgi:hypothetical protein